MSREELKPQIRYEPIDQSKFAEMDLTNCRQTVTKSLKEAGLMLTRQISANQTTWKGVIHDVEIMILLNHRERSVIINAVNSECQRNRKCKKLVRKLMIFGRKISQYTNKVSH